MLQCINSRLGKVPAIDEMARDPVKKLRKRKPIVFKFVINQSGIGLVFSDWKRSCLLQSCSCKTQAKTRVGTRLPEPRNHNLNKTATMANLALGADLNLDKQEELKALLERMGPGS